MTTPVLIVGAGPVGLTMACELARYGVPLRIVDKAATRTDKSKALVVWSRTLELLARADLAAPFVSAGLKMPGANMFAGKERLARLDFESVASPFRFALALPQSETERLLEERLRALGLSVDRQTELLDFTQGEDIVSCVLRAADGQEQTVDASWVIGCDGAHSTIRHRLGLAFRGNAILTDFALADIHLSGLETPADEIAIHMHPEGVIAYFPLGKGRWRIIADLGPSHGGLRPDPSIAEIQALVTRRTPGVSVFDPVWISAFVINERMVDSYRSGRVFLAGDAAHVHSPAGGQGMNTGMQDAFNLAWKLALVVKGLADPETLLDSYSPERSAVASGVLRDSGRLTEIATLKNPVAENLRNFIARHVLGFEAARHALATRLSETSIGYPASPLNAGSAGELDGPEPGARFVADEPFGSGSLPRFSLAAAPSREASRILGDFARIMEPELRTPPDPRGAWLVRPDGYVAAAARAEELAPIEEALARIVG